MKKNFSNLDDIVIFKKNFKDKCKYNRKSFSYETSKNIIVDKSEFNVKRIQVWQMIQNDEQKKKKEEQNLMDNMLKEKTFEYEQIKIKEKSTQTTIEYQTEIQQIKEWSNLMNCDIIFDSNICQWNLSSSMFDKYILNRKNL